MKMNLIVLAAVLSVVATAQTTKQWSQEPDSFLGLKFDAGAAEYRSNTAFLGSGPFNKQKPCSTSKALGMLNTPWPANVRVCSAQINIASIHLEGPLIFADNFNEKYGWAAIFSFDAESFERIHRIFIERYGKPHKTSNTEVKNRVGGTFMNLELQWTGKLVEIRLARYGNKLNKSSLMIGLRDVIKSWDDKTKADDKKAADKL